MGFQGPAGSGSGGEGEGSTGPTGPTGNIVPYIFDGGNPSSVYTVGPAFNAGGVGTGPTGGTNLILQFRRGTPTEWTTANPILADGEFAIETGVKTFKIGDGSTSWNSLAYAGFQGATGPLGSPYSGFQGVTGPTGVLNTTVTSLTVTGGAFSVQQIQETVVTIASPGSSTTLNWNNGAIGYVTSMSANFTINITNLPTTANKSYVVTLILVQGGTAYYANVLQIAGSGVTIKWPAATAPTVTANRVEVESFTLYYSGSAWTALGQLTSFG
jgi:hypothetical protein